MSPSRSTPESVFSCSARPARARARWPWRSPASYRASARGPGRAPCACRGWRRRELPRRRSRPRSGSSSKIRPARSSWSASTTTSPSASRTGPGRGRRCWLGVPEALGGVGLEGFEARRTTRLSGGEQQRLALAGALAPDPAILVLDEPTANLDPGGALAFAARLHELHRRRRTTIVLIEHRVELAWAMADRVLALGPDGPLDLGTPDEVLERDPARDWSRRGSGCPRSWNDGWWRRPTGRPTRSTPRVTSAEGRRTTGRWSEPPGSPSATRRAGRCPWRHRPDDRRGRADRPRRAERQRQVDARTPPRRPAAARRRVGPPRGLRARPACPPAELARRAGYLFQDPEQQFLADRVADEVAMGLRSGERSAAAGLMAELGLPLERFARSQPLRPVGR